MRKRVQESAFLSMPTDAPGARNVPILRLSKKIEAAIVARGYDPEKINRLRWSFIGASHPSEARVLVDLDDSEAAAILSKLQPLNLHLGDNYAVQMWPIRMETVFYATSGPPGPVSGIRVLHLTDVRGLVGMGSAFAPTQFGQGFRDQPRVLNQTLDMPFHLAGVSQWTETEKTDATNGQPTTIRYQAANSATKISGVPSAIGLNGRVSGGEGVFVDGQPIVSFLPVSVSPLGGGAEPGSLNAPFDFPTGSGAELQAIDAILSLRGWCAAYVPSWSTTSVAIGSVPVNPARGGGVFSYVNAATAFLGFDLDSGDDWASFAMSGAFASMPAGAAGAGGFCGPRDAIALFAANASPPTTIPLAVANGAIADLFRGMPDFVIPTFVRTEVVAKAISASPETIFDWSIVPAARTSSMRLDPASAQVPRRYWQYAAISSSGTMVVQPIDVVPSSGKILRLDLTEHAVVDPSGNAADKPINSTTSGTIASALQSHFGQGTIESNATRAAQDFFGRFLCPCGEVVMTGLLVFDLASWWPGIQYAEWSFARYGEPTTRIWGDFWHPSFGFVRSKREGDRWRIDPSRPVSGAGSVGVDAPSGRERALGDLDLGHLQGYLGVILASVPIRFDTGTGLPVAWLYRVRIGHPISPQYGARKIGSVYQPESSATLPPDKNYSDLWIPNLDEVANTGGTSLHGSGTQVNYAPTGDDPKIVSAPVRNGIPVVVWMTNSDQGGTAYAFEKGGPFSVTCTPAASITDEDCSSIDAVSWFTGGLVQACSGSSSASGSSCSCGSS